MSEEKVGLVIDVDNVQAKKRVGPELEASMKKSAKSMEKDAAKVERKLKDVGKSAKGAGRSILDAGRDGSKGAGIAGAGFASLSAGISASQASAESFGTSMIGVSASVASAFAVGGPVGAGVALVSVGIGALIGQTNKVSEAAQKAALDFSNMARESHASLRSAAKNAAELGVILQAMRTGESPERKLEDHRGAKDLTKALEDQHTARERLAKLDKEALSAVAALTHAGSTEIQKAGMLAEVLESQAKARKEANEAIRTQTSLVAELLRTRSVVSNTRKFTDDRDASEAKDVERRAVGERRIHDLAQSTARERADELRKRAAGMERIRELERAGLRDRDTEAGKRARGIARINELKRANAESDRDAAKASAASAKTEREKLDLLRQQAIEKARAAGINRSLDEELELLRAGNRFEEERIRLEHDKKRLIEQGADAKKVELVQQEKLAKLAKEEADDKNRAADAEERKSQSSRSAGTSRRGREGRGSVTDSFRRIGGSQFGFGKGRVGFGVTSERKVSRQKPKTADPTPELKAAIAAQREANQKLVKLKIEIKKQEIEIKRATKEAAGSAVAASKVAAGIRQMVQQLNKLRAEMEAAARAAAQAGLNGVAGG